MELFANYPLGHAFALCLLLGLTFLAEPLARIKLFSPAVETGGGRFVALDGLRGFLALAVVFHHASCYAVYWRTGVWNFYAGPYQAYGPLAVNVFFLITGFLFWTKAIKANGRIEPIALLASRVRRLVPLYAFLAISATLAALIETRGHLAQPGLIGQIVDTYSMGVYNLTGLGGSMASKFFGEATWTLWWEWRFYLLLPVLAGALTIKSPVRWLILIAPFAFFRFDVHIVAFLLGISCAYLMNDQRLAFLKGRHIGGAVCLAGLIVGLCLSRDAGASQKSYVLSCLCCVPILLPILLGNDLWGLLSRPGARYLGGISYSLYLLHCAVLYGGFRIMGMGVVAPNVGELTMIVSLTLMCVVLVVVASFTFRFIEHPFMRTSVPSPVPATSVGPKVDARDVEKETERYAL